MDKFSYPSLQTLRNVRSPASPLPYPNVVPFGPLGGGQWTGDSIGLFIVMGFVLIALVGVPESRYFFLVSLSLSAILGCVLRLWHQSKSHF
jgi:hypothetical protein